MSNEIAINGQLSAMSSRIYCGFQPKWNPANHWRRMINGREGFRPPSLNLYSDAFIKPCYYGLTTAALVSAPLWWQESDDQIETMWHLPLPREVNDRKRGTNRLQKLNQKLQSGYNLLTTGYSWHVMIVNL